MTKIKSFALFFVLLFSAVAVFAQNEAEVEKGVEFYRQDEYQKAVETLAKAVEADKKNRRAWLYLGMSHVKLNNKSDAVKAFKKADDSPAREPSDPTVGKVEITYKPRVNYTEEARSNGVRGRVKLAVEFGADGTIKTIFPFQRLFYGLTENSVEAARNIRFKPALKDGKPVSTVSIVEYTFEIY
jgi:tetratricopeptide (TPR) repeat protein